MPLKLSVGVSRKVGQPGYGSIGAACGVEVEVDSGLLREDPEEFQRQARSAYTACAQAVDVELARLGGPSDVSHDGEHDDRAPMPPFRPATTRQLRALAAIAGSRGETLDALLAGLGLDAGGLSAAEASRTISGLRAAAAG